MVFVAVVVILAATLVLVESTTNSPSCGGRSLPSDDGVSVVCYGWGASNGTRTTVSVPVPFRFVGLFLAFVSYVNSPAGGNVSAVTTDVSGAPYAPIYSTGLGQPFTEQLYWGWIGDEVSPFTVSALTSGGSSSLGTTVAVVLVSIVFQGGSYIQIAEGTAIGAGMNATVGFATNPGGVVVLGVTAAGPASPLSPVPGETRLNTGNAVTGPGAASVGFGTFAAVAGSSHAQPAALLRAPGPWDAIGIELSP